MQIQGNTYLVTGGASGLGAATAEMIVSRGGRVVIADLNQGSGNALLSQLGDAGRFVLADVTDAQQMQGAVDTAVEFSQGNGLRGLVCCAGIGPAKRVVSKEGEPHDLSTFAKVIEINLIGTFNAIRLAAAAMTANGPQGEDAERGILIGTASIAAFDGQLGQAAYAASKGGVVAMTLPIAREMARHGIRMLTIAPGVFFTPMVAAMPTKVQESLGQMVPFPPRLGKASEFASLACHMIENTMLNGEVVRIDGAIRMGAK